MILVVPKISLPTSKCYLKRKFQPHTFPTPGKSSKSKTSMEGYKMISKKIYLVRMKLNLGLLILHCLQLSTTALHSQVCLPKHCRPVEIKSQSLNFYLPRSDCEFSPLAATHFLVNKLWEFGVRLRYQLQPDKNEYSHDLFDG